MLLRAWCWCTELLFFGTVICLLTEGEAQPKHQLTDPDIWNEVDNFRSTPRIRLPSPQHAANINLDCAVGTGVNETDPTLLSGSQAMNTGPSRSILESRRLLEDTGSCIM